MPRAGFMATRYNKITFLENIVISALRLTDMAMEKRNARDMFRPGINMKLW